MRGARAYVAIIVAVIGVSFASIFIRWSESHALVKATYRMGLASLFLLPIALGRFWGEIKNLDRRQILTMIAVGTALAVHFATWISSLDYTSVASSVILVNSHPLLVALLSHYLMKEMVPRMATLGILLGFTGVFIIAMGDVTEASSLVGDLLALVGGLMTAIYLLAGRRIRQTVSLVPYVFLVYSSSSLVLLAATVAIHGSILPGGNDMGRELLLFLGLAVVSTLLGHTLYNWSLRYIKTPVVSTSLLGEPVLASMLALVLLAEMPSPWDMAGGAVALLGIYLTARGMVPTTPREPPATALPETE